MDVVQNESLALCGNVRIRAERPRVALRFETGSRIALRTRDCEDLDRAAQSGETSTGWLRQ